MITASTVLILGAGASANYGYPAGSDFQNRICVLADDDEFLEGVHEHGITNVGEFLSRYSRSAYGSPDRFLEDFPQFIAAGKYCIAKVLKSCENVRNLFPPNGPTPSWYQFLANKIYPTTGDYVRSNLSAITFNYDRSLEHYLWEVCDSRFSDDHDARDAMWLEHPTILHVHGQLGMYDPLGESGSPYVSATGLDDLDAAQQGIKIITEMEPEDDVFERAEALLEGAENIYFLGFGFDERNVRRLRYFPRDTSKHVSIGGTNTGIPNHEWGAIVDKVFEGKVNARAFDNSTIYNFLSKPGVLS